MPRRPAGRLPLQLYDWLDTAVLGAGFAALAAGFGQFGAIAALGTVARDFGAVTGGVTIAEQAGLSGTELGVGLAVLHLASFGGLVLAGLADRFGRRPVLLATCAVGLGLTACAALSPTYWWFVAIFALGRPMLSATASVAQVSAAEETSSAQRAKAVALIAGAYGVGSGLTAVINGLWGDTLGFRGVFALALVPLALLPLIARWVAEPDRFTRSVERGERRLPTLGAVARPFRGRLLLVVALAFAISVVTGPANGFMYLYAQNVVGLAGAAVAGMVVTAGAFGLLGLILGRWLADRAGRRVTAALSIVGVVVCGWLAYSGPAWAVVIGYVLGILAASTFAPAGGALVNELFPTAVRASVVGWQVGASVLGAVTGTLVFGAIADAGDSFVLAALVTFTPAALSMALFARLPETKGLEPEQLWPDQA